MRLSAESHFSRAQAYRLVAAIVRTTGRFLCSGCAEGAFNRV